MQSVRTPHWLVTPDKVDVAIQLLVETSRPRMIYAFGSYVRGTIAVDSDLDLLVVVADSVHNTRHESIRLRHALRAIDMPIDLLVVRESVFDALKDQIGLIYREVAHNGRLLYDVSAT